MSRTKSVPTHDDYVRDCVMPGELAPAGEEAAYRRGFQQGAFQTASAIWNGTPLSVVSRWINGPLYKWRHRGKPWSRLVPRKPEYPPACPVPKEGKS